MKTITMGYATATFEFGSGIFDELENALRTQESIRIKMEYGVDLVGVCLCKVVGMTDDVNSGQSTFDIRVLEKLE